MRTLLVNPSEEMKKTYQFLLDCEELILKELKQGNEGNGSIEEDNQVFIGLDVPLCNVYKLIREKVEKERPELANKMTNNLGFDSAMIKVLN